MNEIIISIITWIWAVTISVLMMLIVSFSAVYTVVFIGRIAASIDSAIHILTWRKKIPANEWKRIREIALPHISKK